MNWEEAVEHAIRRYTSTRHTPQFKRQGLLAHELSQIVQATGTTGDTPHQTLSRTLQLLRDKGVIKFIDDDGTYEYLRATIAADQNELSDAQLDEAIQQNRLEFGTVPTSDDFRLARYRRGQDRLRYLTLSNYGGACAVCDITDHSLLVTSHVVRWADDISARGDLSNVMCLCRFHDVLFELGYFSVSDDLRILKRCACESQTLRPILDLITEFTARPTIAPSPRYLARHRKRTGHG